jgi:hypothetical protein
MSRSHAVPATTIPALRETDATSDLLTKHRDEAQRIFNSYRRGGLTRRQALAKARRPIQAARYAQELRRAEMANLSAAG